MNSNSQVQGNTVQFANALLRENLFCIYAVSNLSSEACLCPIKHVSKPCSEDHDLDPSSFSCCTITTKSQNHFPLVWI